MTNEEHTTISIWIGSVGPHGLYSSDQLRPVEFKGRELAIRATADDDGTRGVTLTLYESDDGRLLIHQEDWSRWGNEYNTSSLFEIEKSDLEIGAPYEFLGRMAGFGRPLTLAEALDMQR